MAHYDNHAPVSNQAGIQNIYGNVTFNNPDHPHKRPRHVSQEPDSDTSLDNNILASLAFPEMHDRRSMVESAHPQTCQWIFDHDAYRNWTSGHNGLLWIKGKPGSGKSTLMSHLHRALCLKQRTEHDVNLEFFFSARGTILQRTTIGMIRSLLNQIYHRIHTTRKYLRDAYLEKRRSFGNAGFCWQWQLPELQRLLMETISAGAQDYRITILIDALDEADDEAARSIADYLHVINDCVVQSAGMAKICISCRHYPVVAEIDAIEVHMEHHNAPDIELFVKDQFKARMVMVVQTRQDVAVITSALVDMASGIFQWICLIVPMIKKWLSEGDSTEDMVVNLSKVPKDLEAVYEYILERVIDPRHRRQTLRLFRWVCFAQRPLSVIELRYALAAEHIEMGPYSQRCHKVRGFENSGEIMCRRITTWSGGLLETVSNLGKSFTKQGQLETSDPGTQDRCTPDDSRVVQAIHQSVIDHMVRNGLFSLSLLGEDKSSLSTSNTALSTCHSTSQCSHGMIYIACLKYISTEPYKDLRHVSHVGQLDKAAMRDEINQRHPFLQYAARYGLFHAEKSDDYRIIALEDEHRLLDMSCQMWKYAREVFERYRSSHTLFRAWPLVRSDTTTLHLAAIGNLVSITRYGIASGDRINSRDVSGWTALHLAVHLGNVTITKMLLEAGAEVESKTALGDTPLFLAAKRGHSDVFSCLLNHGATLQSINRKSECALYMAAQRGNTGIVEICIGAGADVDAQGGMFGNALQAAICRNHEPVVRLLLKAGADVNASGGFYGTALHASVSESGNLEMLRLLIEAGADLNARGGAYGNALTRAARHGREESVRMLLKAGADVNGQDSQYGAVLQTAVSSAKCTESIVQLLLKAGADVNAQGGLHGSALRAAQALQRHSIIDMLKAAGAESVERGSFDH